MQELQKQARKLLGDIKIAVGRLDIAKRETELEKLKKAAKEPGFWQNNQKAQENMRRQAALTLAIEPWRKLEQEVHDLNDLLQMDDTSMQDELEEQHGGLVKRFEELKFQLKFSGPYDSHNAILSIYAGAGGTDAQDWAQMLERMYLRWAEKSDVKSKVIDESSGDEAGIKSATIELSGEFVYGKLKGEHGVHRLVRLSPFNADNLRQTSFAKVEIMPEIESPEDVELDDKDLKIDVYRAGGHGGQSVNTTDSAVRVTHVPTGINVAIQNERSQLQNKETALNILRSKLARLQVEQHKEHLSELKGPSQSAEWGNQIRSYVLHPYKQVKDLRTRYETSDPDAVLDGALNPLIDAYLEAKTGE